MTGDHNLTQLHLETALGQCQAYILLNSTLQSEHPDVTTLIMDLCPYNCSNRGLCSKGWQCRILLIFYYQYCHLCLGITFFLKWQCIRENFHLKFLGGLSNKRYFIAIVDNAIVNKTYSRLFYILYQNSVYTIGSIS